MGEKASQAVRHILRGIVEDGKLTFLVGPTTEAFALLTDAYAEDEGMDVEQVRRWLSSRLRPERIHTDENVEPDTENLREKIRSLENQNELLSDELFNLRSDYADLLERCNMLEEKAPAATGA